MHISEGILPPKWAGAWYAAAAVFVYRGIREIERKAKVVPGYKPLLGMTGAFVFVISSLPIPVPIAGTCSHPAGTGLAAILLGPFPSAVVTSVVLLLQALFMAHGGLTTLGANIMSMGVAGSFAGYAAYRLAKRRLGVAPAAFLAGFLADVATYATTSVELGLGIHGSEPAAEAILKIMLAFVPTQLPLAILEGAFTAGVVAYVYRHRPDIMAKLEGFARKGAIENA